jgi:hypothetical protein
MNMNTLGCITQKSWEKRKDSDAFYPKANLKNAEARR